MTHSEKKLRNQIFRLNHDIESARSKNTQGEHFRKDMEKNYADKALMGASRALKIDSDRLDYRDNAKRSKGSEEQFEAGQDGEINDPFENDSPDENERMQYPNLSRIGFSQVTESQQDLREFNELQPPDSIISPQTSSSLTSSSPVCPIPTFSDQEIDTETPLYTNNYMSGDDPIKMREYAKPNFIDLKKRRSNTVHEPGVARNEVNKRSYSYNLVDSPVPISPHSETTPNGLYIDDESAFTPDNYDYGYDYDHSEESSPAVTDISDKSQSQRDDLDLNNYDDPNSTQDDSDSEYEYFIDQKQRDLHLNDTQDGRASPYYQPGKTEHYNTQPHPPIQPQVKIRKNKSQDKIRRQTMPPQSEYAYASPHHPSTPYKSRSNHQVPDPSLVLRPVASAKENQQKYEHKFRPRKASNNTIAGYPPTRQPEVPRKKFSHTNPTRGHMRQHQDYRREQGTQSAFQRYPVSPQYYDDEPPDAFTDDVYQNSQPYETVINSNHYTNVQPEIDQPQYYHHYTNPPRDQRLSSMHQNAYVSPQHSTVTPINQNYYCDNSPVDSGIDSLHNFVERPQTVAAQAYYPRQEFDYDDGPTNDSPPMDIQTLVSQLQNQIKFLSIRVQRFESRKPSESQEITSPIPQVTSPVLSPHQPYRSPSATSSGSEGGRKKRSSPYRVSPNLNTPLPNSRSKPPVYSQTPDRFREPEQKSRHALPQSPRPNSRTRVNELTREFDKPPLHTQFSAPSLKKPPRISRTSSGLSEGGCMPPRVSPIPTNSHSLHPTTRYEASQNASNVIRAKSSIGTPSSSMLPMQKKTPARYQAPPPIKTTHSVSPQPRSILRPPRSQHSREVSRMSDGYNYDEDSFKNTTGIQRAAYKKKEYY